MSVQRQGQQSSSRSVVLNPYTVERRDVSEFWKIHRDFPRAGILHPEAREIARGLHSLDHIMAF